MRRHFVSSRTRIKWAKEDAAHFERSARRFFKGAKGAVVVEPDVDGIYEVHKFRLKKPLPDVLTKKTVSSVENLRAALDSAVYEIGGLAGAPKLDKLYFPFCATKADLASRIDSCCKGIPKEIRSLLASYEPYEGGEEVVWAINELCRASKHRIIIPVNPGASVVFSHFEIAGGTRPVYVCDGQSILCDENEIIIARTERGSKYNYKASIAFGVAFGPVRPIEGREVFPNLNRMLDAVSAIVNELEQECKKISLI